MKSAPMLDVPEGPTLMALDPGIDATGVAFFALRQWGALLRDGARDMEAAVGALVGTTLWQTDPKDSMPHRCGLLAVHAEMAVRAFGVRFAVIEVPAKDGAYFGRQKRQRTKGSINAAAEAKLNRAIGALSGGLRLPVSAINRLRVAEIPASHLRKSWRQDQVKRLMENAGYRGRNTIDIRDAVWVGAQALASDFSRELREALEAA